MAVYFALYVFPFPLTYVSVVGAAARWLGRVRHAFEVDPEARSMSFATFQDRETKHLVSYRELEDEGDRLRIEGELFGRVLEVDLVRKDAAEYLLVDRGFHWINEFPFNR